MTTRMNTTINNSNKNDEKPTTVTIKQYRGNEEVTPIEITSFDKAFEAIRDMCLPMVYNW